MFYKFDLMKISKFKKLTKIFRFCNEVRMDALRCMYISAKIQAIPLGLQITHICGNTMARTLQGGRAERNSFLLLHAFHEKGKRIFKTSFFVIGQTFESILLLKIFGNEKKNRFFQWCYYLNKFSDCSLVIFFKIKQTLVKICKLRSSTSRKASLQEKRKR